MKLLLVFTSLVLIFTLVSAALPVNGEMDIYDSVVRLHIIANSDSDEDQTLKLKIRDAILDDMKEYMSSSASVTQAEQILKANSERIREVAQNCVYEHGYEYDCRVELGYEYYPTRQYEDVSLPSGTYCSLRVQIGEAVGQNWWCVLFPPLCIGAASAEDGLISAGLTADEVDILCQTEEPKYVIKFKVLEFFNSVFKKK